MVLLREDRIGDLLGSVAIRLIIEGLCLFASTHLAFAALDAKRFDFAA
jgi:hypothetical protein